MCASQGRRFLVSNSVAIRTDTQGEFVFFIVIRFCPGVHHKIEILFLHYGEWRLTTNEEMTSTDYWTSIAVAATPAAPRIRLSPEERRLKSDQHHFGLCCLCDAGIDDRADFVCSVQSDGRFTICCNNCDIYYSVEESIEPNFGSSYDEWSF